MNMFNLFKWKRQPEAPPERPHTIPHDESLQELVNDILKPVAKEADRMVIAATEIMLINLKTGFGQKPYITTDICKIKSEDSMSFVVIVNGKERTVTKTETNDIKFVEVHSMVDNKMYWHIDCCVYAEIDRSSPKNQFIEFWVGEIKKRTMQELKAQNNIIKALYNDITDITA